MQYTVTFDNEESKFLKAIAKNNDMSVEELIYSLETLEDKILAVKGEEEYQKFLNGDRKVYTQEELEKEFGIC